MNTKGKGEKERAIIGIVLVAIMIASVFAGISASAIASDNETNESVDDGVVAGSQVEEESVVASAVGSVTVERASDSPSANIANESANFTNILKLQFSASGESANITKLVIEEVGTIDGKDEITGVGVNTSEKTGFLTSSDFSVDNDTATLTIPGGYEVPVGTPKYLYVWVNTSAFTVGDTIKLRLTSFNATGLASGEEMIKGETPVESHEIAGVGKLTVSVGPNSTEGGTINAGENTSIVLMQLNFTATIGGCTLDSVTLTENGTANGTRDFSAIYLVNDSNMNGVWDSGEPIKGSKPTSFSADNGTATITGIDQSVPLDSSVYMLVVVNTTKWFWSGDTLAVNISSKTHVNTTEEWGVYPDTTPVVSSNVTTGRAKIQVTAGPKQPYLDYVLERERGLVENAQLNFTAIAGQVNITQITLEQWTTTNWATASGETYPKIYIDEDGDGNVTSYDTPLNISAGNFTTNNVTLMSYNSTSAIMNGLNYNYTDNAEIQNALNLSIYLNRCWNETDQPWSYNVSINYTDANGVTKQCYINLTNKSYDADWNTIVFSGNTSEWNTTGWEAIVQDPVKDIINVTFVRAENADNCSFDIVAPSCVVNVTLDRNLTIGSRTETDAGQESKLVIIAVNTTSDWKSENKTKALPNTITKYGNWSNYVAYDNTTGLNTEIYQSNDPPTGAINGLTAAGAVGVTNPSFLVKTGDSMPEANVGSGTNLSPVLQLNFSYMGDVEAGASSTVYIRQIVVSTNGTVNESGNVTACLVVDTDNDGAVSPGEAVIATEEYTTDNETVKLTPSSPIELEITSDAPATYKNVLIAVNTSSDIERGETLQFYIDNTSMDYIADGCAGTAAYYRMVVNETSDKIVGNELTVAGTITATRTDKVSDGTVSSEVNESFVELMQLKFTASETEAVNITSINVTWNGTGTGATKTSGIGIFNDTDADGVWDATDTEPILNATTFAGNVAFLNLSFNDNNITVPAGGSVYAVIYVNTTAQGINASDEIKVNITAAPYLNYTAYGIDSNVTLTDLQTTAISSATMTAKWTGNVSVTGYNLTDTTWVEGAQTNFPVLALNFSAVNETVNITSITLTASGSANESGNVTARLVVDSSPYGSYESETILATADFTTDNGTVTLTPSPEIQVAAGNFTRVLVVANITANVQAGQNVTISLKNPSTDYIAIGYYSRTRVQDSSTNAISNTTWATGNVTVSAGTNTTLTGPITAMNATFVPIMQLNFSATPEMEDVNITGITLNASGLSSDAYNDTWGVGIYNDTNGNGVIDDGEVKLGNGTFDINGTAVISFHTNLTINGTASQTWANVTFNNTVVYVNTSDNFNVSDYLQIKLESYNATGVSSGQSLTAFGVSIMSNKLTGTGNITVVNGTNTPSPQDILAGANTTVPVWQLNLSTNLENATLNSITLTFNGTADVTTDIAKVDLYYDGNSNGTVEAANDTLIASGTISDSKVTLEPTETFYINTTVKSLLVTVNTTSGFKDNDTIAFNITVNTTAPEMATPDVNATGVNSSTVIATNYTVPLSSNTLRGYGSIDLYAGDVQSDTTNQTTNTNVSVMELNFSAPRGKINITNITVTWNGSADKSKLTNISIWQDDGDGTFNESSDTLINMTTFPTTGNITIETTAAGNPANLTVDGVNNVYIVVKIGASALTADNTLGFDVNQTLGVGYNATCNETGHGPYSTENQTITGKISVTGAAPAAEFSKIDLKPGWNFISVPKKQDSTKDTFEELLAGIDFSAAYAYDPDTGWTQLTGSETVNVLDGYWINANTAGTIELSYLTEGKTVPPSKALTGNAWNAIGFSNTTAMSANATLKSVEGSWSTVLGWDATNQKYENAIIYEVNDGTNMEPGKGYWIWMTKDDTLSAISA